MARARTGFLAVVAFTVAAMLLVGAAPRGAAAARPNFVFVMADDLDSDYKQDHLSIMPNLRTYWAQRGLEFVNHVAALPVCGPSRSSLLAGRYPHNTGYYANADAPSVVNWRKQENTTFGTMLSAAGYHTAFLGKYVNGMSQGGYVDIVSGWNRWGSFTTGVHTYNFYNSSINEARFTGGAAKIPDGPVMRHDMLGIHQADYLGNVTIDEARRAVAAGKPFAIHVTPTMVHWGTCVGPCRPGSKGCYGPDDPHWEWSLPQPGTNKPLVFPCDPCPTMRHAHLFDNASAPHEQSWNATLTRGTTPEFMEAHFESHPLTPTQEQREDMCFRNRSSSAVDLDDMLGVVVDGLKELGVFDNTILIFTSDNGFHLGEHRLPFGKGEPYSTDVTLPFYIAGPGIASGFVRHHPTNHMDVTATILDLAGAQPLGPQPLDGQSFAAALSKDPVSVADWRQWQYSEYFGNNNTWQALRFVNASVVDRLDPRQRGSTTTMALHRWCTGETELYDLESDPWQLSNIAEPNPSPEAAAFLRQHLPTLAALGSCKGDSCRNPGAPPGGPVPPLPCHKLSIHASSEPWDL